MKKVVYQLDIGDARHRWRGAYDEYTIPSAKKYAKKIGADFITIKEPVDEAKSLRSAYQRSIATKVYLFREFLKTDYEKMLFLDCDVFVRDNAPDIFEYDQHKYHDLLIHRISGGANRHHAEMAKDGLNSEAVQFYNTGVFVTGRYSAERIHQSIVELYQGKPPMPPKHSSQVLVGHLIYESETRVYPLDKIWNCSWNRSGARRRRGGFAFFVHYMGPKGKKALVEDARKMGGITC